jgi:NADH:ubiquinone oxidoreductase subunit H
VQGFLYPLIDILAVVLPILLVVAYVTLLERKVLGSMQRRVGPDTVGVYGIAQPFADALKLLVKEMVLPQQSQRVIFILAPAVTLICALLALGVIPFGPGLMIADLELG